MPIKKEKNNAIKYMYYKDCLILIANVVQEFMTL